MKVSFVIQITNSYLISFKNAFKRGIFKNMNFNFSRGLIRLTGKDSLDLLNRLSTNVTNPLEINQFVNSVLLNEKGRIIDLISVFNFDEYILVLVSPEYTSKVNDYLNKYIIMDDVSLEILSDNSKVIWEKKSETTENNLFKYENDVITYSDNLYFNKNVTVLVNEEFKNDLDNEFESFRIENKIPLAPNELNENINPLECGLKPLISFDKGCYIGQEVIARLDAQGKIPKQMKSFECEDAVSIGDKVFYSKEDSDEKTECGYVSSFINKKGLMFIRSITLNDSYSYFTNTKNIFTKIKFN